MERGRIEDIATQTIVLEDQARFPYATLVRLLGGFTPSEAEFFGGELRSTFPMRAFVLDDVLIDPRSWHLRKGDTVVVNPAWHADPLLWPPALSAPLEKIEGPLILAWNKSADNHFHWLVEVLPAIVAGAKLWPDAPLLCPSTAGFKAEALAALGMRRTREFASTAVHRCRKLLYVEHLTGASTSQVSRVARDAYAALSAAVPARSPLRKIYVSRGRAGHRRLLNEARLLPVALHRGYAAVVLDGLTMAEQVSLFRGADAVIGLHGAGLTNIVFCQPGTDVLEILPGGFVNPCFNVMAKAARLNYWGIVQPSLPHEHDHCRDVEIGLETFSALLEEFDDYVSARRNWPCPTPVSARAP